MKTPVTKTPIAKALFATMVTSMLSASAMADIVITEYIEGSASNKAVEITNLGNEAVDLGLGVYKLAVFSNGNTDEGNNELLTGVLAPGQSFVLFNADADPEFKFDDPTKGIASTATFFNGDDALVLTKDGTVVDSFGKVGEDPGSSWSDVNNADWATANKTLRRKANVTTGDIIVGDDFPGGDNQWVLFDINTADGLGCSGEAACGAEPPPAADPIMFTEYVEGSGNNKAIEISNMGSTTVDLAGYKVALFGNGGTTEGNSILLTGTLAAGASYVIYNESADPAFVFSDPARGISSNVTFYNGDDALVLTKDDVVIDSFGRVGEDPGSFWTDANDSNWSTQNKTLRRKTDVTAGDAVIDDAFPGDTNQWLAFDIDTADGLGCNGIAACTTTPEPPTPEPPTPEPPTPEPPTGEPSASAANIIITEYIEGSANNKAIEISNLGTENVDLWNEGFRLAAYNNGGTDITNSELLVGILVPNSSLVIYNSGASAEFIREAPQGLASNVTFFNGDDALILTSKGVVIDSLGRFGEDPGSEWVDANDPNFSTANKTIRRKAGIITGDTTVNDEFPGAVNQWVTFDINTSDGLGCHGEAACTGNEPLPLPGEQPVQEGLCQNCPDIVKIADASTFDDNAYYAAALAANDSELAGTLGTIAATGHVQLSYSEIWSVITFADEDPANADNIIEIYKGDSIAKWSNGSGNNSSNPDAWNREHVWSKSHGFPDPAQMAYTDAHHLRPADASMNTLRSNLDFDISDNAIDESPQNAIDEDSFEPRDAVKGDVARMMFYMATRYNGAEADNTPDLTLVDFVPTQSGSAEFGKLCALYEWHLADSVDSFERHRNEVIYEYQGNRNPFIDHPEFADRIFGANCQALLTIDGPFLVNIGDTVTLTSTAVIGNVDNNLTYHWQQVTGALISFDSAAATISFTAPNVGQDTPVRFRLSVTDGETTLIKEHSLVIRSNDDGVGVFGTGGSIGWLSLLLLPLVAIRRRRLI